MIRREIATGGVSPADVRRLISDTPDIGPEGFTGWLLRCPGAGHDDDGDAAYMHLQGIEVRNTADGAVTSIDFSTYEDDPAAPQITIISGASFSTVGPYPPSIRRLAVMLVYECESERHRFGLTFSQHKGLESITAVVLDIDASA